MRKLTDKNRLSIRFPHVAQEWHEEKNGILRPHEFSYGSTKIVWWQCRKHGDHIWEASINTRTSNNLGCPFCRGKRAHKDNNLLKSVPEVSYQWHPTKNGKLRPSDLLPQDPNSTWAQVNPSGQGDLKDQNFLNAGYHVGINTVGQTLRNANMQLRSEPPNPQVKVSPWQQTTIEPDTNRRAMEIGGCE